MTYNHYCSKNDIKLSQFSNRNFPLQKFILNSLLYLISQKQNILAVEAFSPK